ncbi:MAG: NlpC/P60 family protein [Candidatus Nanopelagicales bacterium]
MSPGRNRTTRGLIVLGASAALVSATLLGAPATSANPERISQIEAQLDVLGQEQAYANEMVLTAQYEFDELTAKMDRTRGKVDRAKDELAETQGSIGRYAAATYRSGGIDSSLQLLLADDPQEFLDSAIVLDIIANGQSAALRKSQVARLKLAQATAELSQQQAQAEIVLADMESKKVALDEKIAETEAYLAQLKEEERQRIEEERKRREAAQRAAAAEAAAQAATASQSSNGSSSSSSGSSSGGSSSGSGSSNGGYSGGGGVSSDRAAVAVAAALAQVGEPYVNTPPGAQPPNSWDCSKLTAWAWAQAGVGLTPYSAAQINQVRTISQNELQPGDLLFYYNPSWGRVGHVSMYIGGGMVVEASTPSTGVRIHPVYWSNFVKAGRPFG